MQQALSQGQHGPVITAQVDNRGLRPTSSYGLQHRGASAPSRSTQPHQVDGHSHTYLRASRPLRVASISQSTAAESRCVAMLEPGARPSRA